VQPDLAGTRALVTGAAGFIGSSLVLALLETGAEVHALVRPGARHRLPGAREVVPHEAHLRRAGDVARAFRTARPDVVFHLAAAGGHPGTAGEERVAMLQDTVSGTANLLAAAADVPPARLVHLGSFLEYGRLQRPAREDDRLAPETYRGAAKVAATMLVLQYALEAARSATILRPYSVYGPREDPARFVPRAVQAALDGQDLPLAVGPRRDFVYVDDVVDAMLLGASADLAPGEIVNVGTGVGTANEELVEALIRVTGAEVRVRPGAFEQRPWDTSSWVADPSKAARLLGWRPAHTLEQGLEKTFDWFRSERALAG